MNIIGFIVFCLIISCSVETSIDLTIEISAGKQECFWQCIPAATEAEVDYQVIDGGDLDIWFAVYDTAGHIVYTERRRKRENIVEFKSTVEGDYKICFDNTFSTISKKVVYFEISVKDNKYEEDEDYDYENINFEEEDIKDQLDMTVHDFVGILERSKNNLLHSIMIQAIIRVHEARDRKLQEGNFFRVNFFSCVQLTLMILVGLVQVVMIRSLFMDKRPVSGSSIKSRT